MATADKPVKIAVRNLYKIFGDDPASILPMLSDGIDKADIQRRTCAGSRRCVDESRSPPLRLP